MIEMPEYAKRRKELMQKIGPKAIVVLSAASEVFRNNDTRYPYRQNSDFYYLTGFEEPEAILVLAPGRKEGEYILFNRVRDRKCEIWDGVRAGQMGACHHFYADQAFPINEFDPMFPELLFNRESLHYLTSQQKVFDNILATQSHVNLVDLATLLHDMRLFKSQAEIKNLQQAVNITGKGHVRAMKACKPGMYEYELEAEIMYEFIRHGARFPAYSSIVGSGSHSCVLHYITNDKQIADGDLVLIDAGAEYQNYAADITRTFPANGRFSAEQRAIYEIVLTAQLAAIESIKPGAAWSTAQDIVVKIITEGLINVGILRGNKEEHISERAYLPFYMHRSGHWLGLDVHDVGRYQIENKWRALEPGMVLTVEPGIYISADIPGVDKRWHKIGVRIEDDVLVTKTGCEVLSQTIPKKMADIEAIMRE